MRKKDEIWRFYGELPSDTVYNKAKCNQCGVIIIGISDRMKKHISKCTASVSDVDMITQNSALTDHSSQPTTKFGPLTEAQQYVRDLKNRTELQRYSAFKAFFQF